MIMGGRRSTLPLHGTCCLLPLLLLAHFCESYLIALDRSSWGMISVSGADRLAFLHSQSTNSFSDLSKTQAEATGLIRLTSFVSRTGRVIDICEALVLRDEVILICSAPAVLMTMFEKHIFPLDKVVVRDLAGEGRGLFSVLPMQEPPQQQVSEELSSLRSSFAAKEGLVVYDGCGLEASPSSGSGFTVLAPRELVTEVRSLLSTSTAALGGDEEWNRLRIQRGRPYVGKELTGAFNALQAGLWHTVHFDKGCYLGQETLSKICSVAGGTKLQLHGVQFSGEGASLVQEGEKLVSVATGAAVGVITSLLPPDGTGRVQGLGYVKLSTEELEQGQHGLRAANCGSMGTVLPVAYPTRGAAQSACPPPTKSGQPSSSALAPAPSASSPSVSEAERKAAKLAEMQRKVNALKKKRQKALE
jgi:folate-binding protein YgfZ